MSCFSGFTSFFFFFRVCVRSPILRAMFLVMQWVPGPSDTEALGADSKQAKTLPMHSVPDCHTQCQLERVRAFERHEPVPRNLSNTLKQ